MHSKPMYVEVLPIDLHTVAIPSDASEANSLSEHIWVEFRANLNLGKMLRSYMDLRYLR